MQRAKWWFVGAVTLVVVLVVVAALRNPGVDAGGGWLGLDIAGGQQVDSVAAGIKAPYTGPAFITGLENLPASLTGTDVDGELKVDANGNLVLDAEVRHLFDYFLSALGEESLPALVARIRAYLRHTLPAAAAAQAEAALDDYLAYREAQSAMPATGSQAIDTVDTDALRAIKAQARELRTRYMDPAVASAFYADEDAWDDYALARVDVMRDDALTPVQKAERSAALVDALPPALQESVRAVSLYANLRELSDDWQQRGGTAAELRSIREAAVGPEAADRLEALDAERAAWQRRVDAYLRARDAILAAPGLGAGDKQRQIEQLRAAGFSNEEQLRLGAFETLHDGGA